MIPTTVRTPYSTIIRQFWKNEERSDQTEDESDALYLNGKVTKYSDQESNSEIDVEDNPVHEELKLLKLEHKLLYHPTIQPLILLYHKK
ncbi:hypothetical protein AVEN_58299-1 [Araneus ventricosus]|uniref:Uncharacterized protein n=1 Tax=Araneus ventricosus TaxID=182803 RepID=A0A4Y2CRN2_ARAVE|nr:hypothetical protein AVEN_58299-1 [Araneus ventricosus]